MGENRAGSRATLHEFGGLLGVTGGCRVDYCRMWLTLDPDKLMPVSDARRWVARSGPRSKHLSSTFEDIHTHKKQAFINKKFPLCSRTLAALSTEAD